MFNNMKNRIREKTGTEIPKFTASSGSLFGKRSNQHSRQSSQGSITSNMSDISSKEESELKSSNSSVQKSAHSDSVKITEERKVETAKDELLDKFAEKENEWREKEKEYIADLLKQTKELQETLSLAEEYKKKYQCCQEEKEQLEIYQKQEVTRIKQLLLAKEEENHSNSTALKDALASVESLKQEIERLRPLEEKVNTSQMKSQQKDDGKLDGLLNKLELLSKENEALKLSNEESRRIYDESLSKEVNKNSALTVEMCRLKEYSQELAFALEKEREVKDKTLFRNAEISQLVQLTEQELKQQQIQNEELFKKVANLEEQLESSQRDLKLLQTEDGNTNQRRFDEKIKELENEIFDKNKTIRILQQNLADVKKTFQDELKNTGNAASHSLSLNHTNGDDSYNNDRASADDDINFKYMKHVLIKFLTSSEYEAQQLTKAVATLLKLNSEEERLIKDTLEWRSSWFGSKPRVKLHYNPS